MSVIVVPILATTGTWRRILVDIQISDFIRIVSPFLEWHADGRACRNHCFFSLTALRQVGESCVQRLAHYLCEFSNPENKEMSHLTGSLSECIRHSRLWSGNRLRDYSNLCLHRRGITAVWRQHAVLHVNRIYLSTGIASACRPAGTISVAVAHSHPNNGSSDYVLLFKQTRPDRRGQSAGHSYRGCDKRTLKLPPSHYFNTTPWLRPYAHS